MSNQLTIRPFQEEEIKRISERKKCGIIWHMGLGKTMCASSVGGRAHLQKWLIICPANAFSVWRDEAPRWIKLAWPEAEVFVHLLDGSPWEREAIWDYPNTSPMQVHLFICTIETFLNDWATKVKVQIPGHTKPVTKLSLKPVCTDYSFPQIVVFDEARKMRNRKSQAFQIIDKFIRHYNIPYFLPMTGTPGNQPQHFFTILNIIEPKLFSSFWKFVSTYHYVFDTPFGKEIGAVKNDAQWHRTLNRYFSVVKETDPGISTQLPDLQRLPLEIDFDPDQAKAFRDLERDMLHVLDDGRLIVTPTTFSLITRLRQIIICPRILSETLGVGSAIKDFAATVDPEEPAHYVIFTPFTEAIDHFRDFLESKGFQHVYRLSGGISILERDNTIMGFKQLSSDNNIHRCRVILCSLLYAQAFSLEPATKCFFIGYDWDPDNNRQAEARLRRLTSSGALPITAYYYTFPKYELTRRMHEIVVTKQERLNITIPDNLRQLFIRI